MVALLLIHFICSLDYANNIRASLFCRHLAIRRSFFLSISLRIVADFSKRESVYTFCSLLSLVSSFPVTILLARYGVLLLGIILYVYALFGTRYLFHLLRREKGSNKSNRGDNVFLFPSVSIILSSTLLLSAIFAPQFFSLTFYVQSIPVIQQSWFIVWGSLVLESIFFIKRKKAPLFFNNLLTIVVLQFLFFIALI